MDDNKLTSYAKSHWKQEFDSSARNYSAEEWALWERAVLSSLQGVASSGPVADIGGEHGTYPVPALVPGTIVQYAVKIADALILQMRSIRKQ